MNASLLQFNKYTCKDITTFLGKLQNGGIHDHSVANTQCNKCKSSRTLHLKLLLHSSPLVNLARCSGTKPVPISEFLGAKTTGNESGMRLSAYSDVLQDFIFYYYYG